MSNYKHGIATKRQATALQTPVTSDGCVQCVIGTAPVNLAANPYDTVHRPFIAYSKPSAVSALGYSADFKNYTLCQSVYATFDVFGVAPLIMINVLDPNKHVSAELSKEVQIENRIGKIDVEGILMDKLVLTSMDGNQTYEPEVDYVSSFATNGTVLISISKSGAAAAAQNVKATYIKLEPSMVNFEDIIGGYDVSTKKKTGSELISNVYPMFGVVPGLILSPGWTHNANVNIALNAKANLIYSLFTAKVISDLDSSDQKADSIDKVKEWKNENGYTDRTTIPCWAKVKVGDYQYYFSAQLAALLQYLAYENGGVPSKSPSNKALKITGLVLEDGTEVMADMDEANDYCNACGVVTAINMNGWRCWGNNTAAYPASADVIDRWIPIVLMFDYIENNFKLSFFQNVDDLTSYKLIDTVVDGFNMQLNGLQGSDDIAGGEITFDHDENPIGEILGGKIVFHVRIGGYTPAEYIEATFEFDPTITEAALKGGS